MEEKQIIAQLKALRTIKPDQEWQRVAKFYITGLTQPRENNMASRFSRGFLSSFNFSFPTSRLAPALISIVIVILVGAGIFANFYLGSLQQEQADRTLKDTPATYLVLADTKLDNLTKPEDIKEVTDILVKATAAIPSAPKDPVETAKIVKYVADINKKIQELDSTGQAGVADLKDKAHTLTSKTAEVLKENINNTTKELAKNLIEALGNKDLTEEQQAIFKEINTDYNNQNYESALEKILVLTNNINNTNTSDTEN